MAKISSKNAIIVVNQYRFPTYFSRYEYAASVEQNEVTGFTDGAHNYLPGVKTATLKLDVFWDSAATKTFDAFAAPLASGFVTIIPEGSAVGNRTIAMPFMELNFNPQGDLKSAIVANNMEFNYVNSATTMYGPELGYCLQDGTTTTTLTGTAVQDAINVTDVTVTCEGTLHVWSATTTDTYVVKVQHSANGTTGWADVITFVANGTTLTWERQAIASGTLHEFYRVLATRTGSAGDTFGFTVHFSHQ